MSIKSIVLRPRVLDRVMTGRGDVRKRVSVVVGGESIPFADGLATPAVSGG